MRQEERFVSSMKNVNDSDLDFTLRPKTFGDYVGQKQMKDNLSVFIAAAKARGDALDHVLLYGPPGLGKTTMSHIIANEMGVNLKITSGPAIERAADLVSVLTNLSENDVLFIDEIHGLNRSVEEILYPALEDFALDIIIGKGPSARSMRLTLPRFTLVGATTRAGRLTGPLRDRFGVICRLEMYSPDELKIIVKRSAAILKIDIAEDAALEIAARSRGTPRIANRLLKRVRDFSQVNGEERITLASARSALKLLDVDESGLDLLDRRLLDIIINKFDGGPVGLDTLSSAINEDTSTIEDVIEPYLIQLGLISRMPRGRVCTRAAYAHIGAAYPADAPLNRQLTFIDGDGK